MEYGTTTYIYGSSKLALKYEDDRLRELIDIYAAENKEFTFSQLCNYILSTADQEGMLDKWPNTSYSQILLNHSDTVKICKMLWELIWAKELMILFSTPHDLYRNSSETYFIANK